MTIQPVMFVLMFAYVFGGAIALPGGGSYHEYLIGGMLGMVLRSPEAAQQSGFVIFLPLTGVAGAARRPVRTLLVGGEGLEN